MDTISLLARILMGLIFTIFGLNGFFHFLPMPPMAGKAGEFMHALLATGYIMPVVKSVEVISGLLFLTGLFVPFALVFIFPIIVNIFLFHFMLAPSGLPIAIVLLVLEIFLVWKHKKHYSSMLSIK